MRTTSVRLRTALLCGAFLCVLGQGQAAAGTGAAPAVTYVAGSSQELCEVSDQASEAANPLDCADDTKGADLGITVYDGSTTWVLFGDSEGDVSPAWFGGADATGYFSGTNPQAGACGGLSLVDVPGLTQTGADGGTCSTGNVFAPDVVFGPTNGQIIGDYVFQPVTPALRPALDGVAAIPGK
jgi:hypothetical protein